MPSAAISHGPSPRTISSGSAVEQWRELVRPWRGTLAACRRSGWPQLAVVAALRVPAIRCSRSRELVRAVGAPLVEHDAGTVVVLADVVDVVDLGRRPRRAAMARVRPSRASTRSPSTSTSAGVSEPVPLVAQQGGRGQLPHVVQLSSAVLRSTEVSVTARSQTAAVWCMSPKSMSPVTVPLVGEDVGQRDVGVLETAGQCPRRLRRCGQAVPARLEQPSRARPARPGRPAARGPPVHGVRPSPARARRPGGTGLAARGWCGRPWRRPARRGPR